MVDSTQKNAKTTDKKARKNFEIRGRKRNFAPMNELNLHISRLLLEHNCVIVPDLGGFVTQYCPAHFDEVAGSFVAPSYQVGFNPLLQTDDGVLAHSFMMVNQTSYDEAVHDIRLCVHQLREALRTRKEVTLLNIGTFKQNVSGVYDFTPLKESIDTPTLFALPPLSIDKLDRTETETIVLPLQSPKDGYTFHISKSMLRSMAAAVVAIVFYFVWAAPLNRHAGIQTNEAQMFEQITHILGNVSASPQQKTEYLQQFVHQADENESISEEELMQGKQSSPAPISTPETDAAPSQQQPLAQQAKAQQAVAQPQQTAYSLVVASQVSISGAEQLVEKLKKSGHEDARVVKRHNVVRVVVGNYPTYSEARKGLKLMRSRSKDFTESWVLKEEAR